MISGHWNTFKNSCSELYPFVLVALDKGLMFKKIQQIYLLWWLTKSWNWIFNDTLPLYLKRINCSSICSRPIQKCYFGVKIKGRKESLFSVFDLSCFAKFMSSVFSLKLCNPKVMTFEDATSNWSCFGLKPNRKFHFFVFSPCLLHPFPMILL